jgi:methionyl-tRNA formyltransferase
VTARAKNLRVGLLGTLDAPFLGHIARELLDREIAIDAILLDSKSETPRDRAIHEERTGGRLPPVPLESFADRTPPSFFVDSHNSETTGALVRRLGLDLLLNAGTPRILKAPILGAPTIGVLNAHPGLLPRFRGCTAVEWALYLDEPVGVTVHLMTEGIDEGPILAQEPVTVTRGDGYVDVRVKVHEAANRLLAESVEGLARGSLAAADFKPQGEGRYFSVIEPDKMDTLKRKLERGEYVHAG